MQCYSLHTCSSYSYSYLVGYIEYVQAKRFPLTSITDIVYNEYTNPLEFKLVFQNTEVILEASNQPNCMKWVEHIREGKYTTS